MAKDLAQDNNRGQEEEKDLYVWTAPSRPFKKRTRDFYVTAVAIASLIGLIMFFIDGFMPVLLIISIVFLYYVMSTIPPENIEYKVTTRGIKVANNLTEWPMMGRFWFTSRFGSELLVVETANFPGRLEMVVNKSDQETLIKVLGKYLTHEEIPASILDKASNWVSKRMPTS